MGFFGWLPSFKLFENDDGDDDGTIPIQKKSSTSLSYVSPINSDNGGGIAATGTTIPISSSTISSNATSKTSPLPPQPSPSQFPKIRQSTSTSMTASDVASAQESTDTLGPLKRSATGTISKYKLNNNSVSSLDPLTDVILQRAHPDDISKPELSKSLSFSSEANSPVTTLPSVPVSTTNPVILLNDGVPRTSSFNSTSSNNSITAVNSSVGNGSIERGGEVGGGFFSILRRSSGRPTTNDELDKSLEPERDEGWKADVVGYIPNTPVPPKYVHVRAHRKKKREFNRVFLAQELKPPPLSSTYVEHDSLNAGDKPIPSDRQSNKHAIWCAKFSKDGRFLAVAGEDKVVRVWEVISQSHDRDADRSGFGSTSSTNGVSRSASVDSNDSDDRQSCPPGFKNKGSFRRLRATRAYAPVFKTRPVREFYGHTSDILDLSWSKNNFLLSSSMDKTVRLWHVDRQECLCSFLHSDFVTSITFHPKDDRFFVSGSLDCKLRLWCIPDKEISFERNAPAYITATAFSPDGNTVIVGCFNGQCLFFDTENLRERKEIRVRSTRGRNSKGSKITGIEVFQVPPQRRYINKHSLFDSDIKLLISTNDSRLRLYNLYDGSMEIKFKGHQNEQTQINASFSDDGRYIITGSEDSRTYIWSIDGNDLYDHVNKKKERAEYEYFHSNKSMVTVAIFAPTMTKRILAASHDPIYDLCDPPPVELKVKDDDGSNITNDNTNEYPPLRPATRKSLHRTGNIIVTADRNGIIKIFRQDCAYEPRKALLDASVVQKKRYSGIALSPTHSWRESFSVHRSRSNRTGSSPRPTIVGNGDTSSLFERGRSRATSIIRSRSPSKEDGYFIRPSSSVLAGLNSPQVRAESPATSSNALRSSNSRSRLNEYYNQNVNLSQEFYSKPPPVPQLSTLSSEKISPNNSVNGLDKVDSGDSNKVNADNSHKEEDSNDSDTILCSNCNHGKFTAKFIGSEMKLVCSRCSTVYKPV